MEKVSEPVMEIGVFFREKAMLLDVPLIYNLRAK